MKRKRSISGDTSRAKRQLERLNEELLELKWGEAVSRCDSGWDAAMVPAEATCLGMRPGMDALERKIMKARYKRMQVFKEIRDHIERLEDENEKDVLVYRYVRNMKWEDIAVKMGYRWAQIHRIHARALKNLKVEIE